MGRGVVREIVVGVRDLKTHLARYLRRVHAGESVVITSRGKPIGRIVPTTAEPDPATVDARVADMVASGLAAWNGQRYQPGEPVADSQGKWSMAEMVVEDRESDVERLRCIGNHSWERPSP